MEVIEGNKLIAEFMGYVPGEDNYHNNMTDSKGKNTYPCLVAPDGKKITHVYYNTSWDWLMPVCIKIGMSYVSVNIKETYNEVLERIEKMA